MLLTNLLRARPDEMAMIGLLLTGYSELEVGLMHTVMAARMEFDAPYKAMYRIRGEEQRIKIADGLARHALLALNENLGNQFAIAVAAMQYCRQIRNQYAHCQWWDGENERVNFIALEEAAKENRLFQSFTKIDIRSVTLSLLESQKEYFEYVQKMFQWIVHQARVLNKLDKVSPFPSCPKPLERPDLYIQSGQHTLP